MTMHPWLETYPHLESQCRQLQRGSWEVIRGPSSVLLVIMTHCIKLGSKQLQFQVSPIFPRTQQLLCLLQEAADPAKSGEPWNTICIQENKSHIVTSANIYRALNTCKNQLLVSHVSQE